MYKSKFNFQSMLVQDHAPNFKVEMCRLHSCQLALCIDDLHSGGGEALVCVCILYTYTLTTQVDLPPAKEGLGIGWAWEDAGVIRTSTAGIVWHCAALLLFIALLPYASSYL